MTAMSSSWSKPTVSVTAWTFPPRFGNQTQQNATDIGGDFEITVIDPQHPLCGRTLKLVTEHCSKGKAYVSVSLPDGRHRAIPRSATNLREEPTPQTSDRPLSRISVRTILPLAHFIQSKVHSLEENSHAQFTDIERTPPQFSNASFPPNLYDLESIDTSSPPGDGAPMGHDAAEDTAVEPGTEA